jgi:hypothetical protein
MKLICDDYNQIYVWVDDQDHDLELSPHFDYEEDAIEWKNRMKRELSE